YAVDLTLVDDALHAERAHGVLDLHFVPVGRQPQPIEPARLIDDTGHHGVGGFRLQVGVTTGHRRDLEAGAVEARVVHRTATTLEVETFGEGGLTYVARLGGTDAQVFQHLEFETSLPAFDPAHARVVG